MTPCRGIGGLELDLVGILVAKLVLPPAPCLLSRRDVSHDAMSFRTWPGGGGGGGDCFGSDGCH